MAKLQIYRQFVIETMQEEVLFVREHDGKQQMAAPVKLQWYDVEIGIHADPTLTFEDEDDFAAAMREAVMREK